MSTAQNNSTRSRVPGTVAISDDEMRRFAPSVFASQPIEGVSEKYSLLPTSSILNGMRGNGWVPVRAQEQSIRTEARRGFQKHVVRFARLQHLQSWEKNQIRPEVVLVNSHDKSSAYQLVPFSSSFAKLEIAKHSFVLGELFTLGATSSGINPVTEKVTLQIGTFSVTIPPSSFKKIPIGIFVFQGVINGVDLNVQIVPLGNKIFAFSAESKGVNLTRLTNPVTVVLTIGVNTGSTTVTAQFP